jgi:hypothetical protein
LVVTYTSTQVLNADTGKTSKVWTTWVRQTDGATATFTRTDQDSALAAAKSWLTSNGQDLANFLFVTR